MGSLHFYLVLLLILTSSLVYFTINPVHSVLFLILAFINTALILFLFKIEFMSFLFIIIYVGAIAILFLFIVMMLNIKKNIISDKINQTLLIMGFIICFSFIFSLKVFLTGVFNFNFDDLFCFSIVQIDYFTDIIIFTQSLYNYNLLLVLIGGLILLIAMLGAIIITLDFKHVNYVELSEKQLARTSTTVKLFKK